MVQECGTHRMVLLHDEPLQGFLRGAGEMNTVEKVARALQQKAHQSPLPWGPTVPKKWDDIGETNHAFYLGLARAAIEALDAALKEE